MKIVCIWCFLVGAAVATSSKFTHSLRGKPDAASNSSGVIPSERLRRMKAVVINLRKREDRWNAFRETVAEHAPWLQVERLDAVNASVEPPSEEEVAKVWSTARLAKLFSSYRAVTVAMSPGERGCAASHLKAWRLCASGSDPILVFEDDAKLSLAFTGILEQAMQEAPDDLGAIWLSNMDRGTRKPAGKVLMEPTYVWTTVGYVLWPAAARKFIELLPMDMPVDNFMAWHIKEGEVKTLSVEPTAVRQAHTWNIGSDVPHSDDGAHT